MSNTFDKLLVNLGRTSLFVIIFFFQSPLFAQHSEISAEEVIRQAIERHKAEEKQESPYSYDAYTKTALRFPPYFPFDTLLNRTLFSLIQPKTDAKNRKTGASTCLDAAGAGLGNSVPGRECVGGVCERKKAKGKNPAFPGKWRAHPL
jgi:hypothetical protein